MDAEVAAVIGLALNGAAYMSEIIRAAIISIDRGQEEAGFLWDIQDYKIYAI